MKPSIIFFKRGTKVILTNLKERNSDLCVTKSYHSGSKTQEKSHFGSFKNHFFSHSVFNKLSSLRSQCCKMRHFLVIFKHCVRLFFKWQVHENICIFELNNARKERICIKSELMLTSIYKNAILAVIQRLI